MGRAGQSVLAATALLLVALPQPASAGNYRIANCTADPSSHSTAAIAEQISRGMIISRNCAPQNGRSTRGLGIGSVSRRGSVPLGANAVLTINAPPGTVFSSYAWTGRIERADCRYAFEIYAVFPDRPARLLKTKRANKDCPKKGRAQAARIEKPGDPFDVTGATQIVQRVLCIGKKVRGRRSGCSGGSRNRMWTEQAVAEVIDNTPPAAGIFPEGALATGQWVNGSQVVAYNVEDNAGVRKAYALIDGVARGNDDRPCQYATPGQSYIVQVPCTNGRGTLEVDTERVAEGSHQLTVRAEDPAGNLGDSTVAMVRIDRTPPGRVDLGLEGGSDWRSRNDFAVWWSNPVEADRAPIVAVSYRLCPLPTGTCITGTQPGEAISRLPMPLPAAGEWTLSLWRHDAAGNVSEEMASEPVTMRFDPDPPELAFEPPDAADPTVVSVKVTDAVSGVADGAIEISQVGSGTWHTLAATRQGDRMTARIDDVALPPGQYELRARASDLAHNEASTNLRADGQQMLLNLPIRVVSTLQSAFQRQRTVRHGRKPETVVVQTQTARVLFGETAEVLGRLVTPAGTGIAGAEVQVLATTPIGPEQLIGVVATDAEGWYRYTASGSSNQVLRFLYIGSSTVLPTQSQLSMTVPAATTFKVNRRRLRNGQAVTFTGPVRTLPTPPGGKLVEMQVKLPGRWETFRTIRTDDAGQWSARYRFRRTSGVQYYRFRARLPAEGAYPFTTGISREITVRVRGA